MKELLHLIKHSESRFSILLNPKGKLSARKTSTLMKSFSEPYTPKHTNVDSLVNTSSKKKPPIKPMKEED
jgi:hypothetical protein